MLRLMINFIYVVNVLEKNTHIILKLIRRKMDWKKLELSDAYKAISYDGNKKVYHSDGEILGTHNDSHDLVYIKNSRGGFVELGKVSDLIELGVLIEKQPEYYWLNIYTTDICVHRTLESAKYHKVGSAITKKVMVVDE